MHQQTRKERLVQFDILKGIGIILVIIGHTSLSGYPKSLIYGFHMPLFFFCSGVFYKDKPFAEVLVKSFKQLIVPYFFFLVVWNWVNMAVNLHGADMHTYLGVLRQNINILDENSYWYKTIWFLPCLFSVRILYAIISGKVKNRIWHACIGGGIYLIGNQIFNISFFIDTTLSVYIYYFLGNLFFTSSLYKKKISTHYTILLFLAYVAIIYVFEPNVNLKNNVFPIYLVLVASLGIYVAYQFALLVRDHTKLLSRFLKQCGESSITLLGFHRPIWLVVNPLCKMLTSSLFVLFLVQLMSALVTILPLHRFFSKYTPTLIGKNK